MALPSLAPLRRIGFLLVMLVAAAFIWEASRNSGLQPTIGSVVGKGYRDYTIRYSLEGQSYQFVTRLGVFDALGQFRSLTLNDRVPVLVNPQSPHNAVINSLNGRYGITFTFAALLLVFAVVVALIMARSELSKGNPPGNLGDQK